MKVTSEIIARRIGDYLHHDLTLEALADWAEDILMNDGVELEESEEAAEVVARLGVADLQAFGLTWEDCEEMLRKLGYKALVEIRTL